MLSLIYCSYLNINLLDSRRGSLVMKLMYADELTSTIFMRFIINRLIEINAISFNTFD